MNARQARHRGAGCQRVIAPETGDGTHLTRSVELFFWRRSRQIRVAWRGQGDREAVRLGFRACVLAGMATDSTPATWVEFKDEDGDPYFFNPATNETTRDQPVGAKLVSEAEYLSGAAGVPAGEEEVDDGHPDDWTEVADDGAT